MSSLTLQGQVVRNATDELQISSGTYWNTKVVDIRWYSDDKPSKKGVRVNIDEAKQLHAILSRILEGEMNVEMD